jgi:hypothetical protein
MNKNFSIDEILESVNLLVSDNISTIEKKEKILNADIEKIISDAEESLKKKEQNENNPLVLDVDVNLNMKPSKPLILNNELTEERSLTKEENIILEGNNLKDLENNFIYKNELLKSKNIKQDEIIKDLNILLDEFKSTKKYSVLDNKIKLFQKDNNELRKKIFELTKTEKDLRLELSEKSLDLNTKNKKD